MNIFKRAYHWFSGNANAHRNGSQDPIPANTVHEDAPNVGVDGALQVSTVWACITILVETIGSLPLHTYRKSRDNFRQLELGTRLYEILKRSPNSRQTAQEFWECMLLNFFLRGNAYARIVRDSKGDVVALWPLSADQMSVIVTDNGSRIYSYSFEGKDLIYTEKDILHIMGMGNGVIGLSPLDHMRSSLGLAISSQNHTTKTFKKSARRPGVLMSDVVLNDDQRKAVKKNFSDISEGRERELYVLEAQFKFESLGMTPADIQLLESRKFSVQDLARWFGVPSVLINDTGETTSLGSSISEIINGFHRLKLRPQLSRIEQAIEKRVLSPLQRAQGISVEFNLDALLRSSLEKRMEIYAKAVQNGIKTRNECRAYENDEPKEGGDILTAQTNLVPLDKLGQQITQTKPVPEEPVQQ